MRPRKRVLLWAEREDQAGALAFVLNQQPFFAVTKAPNDRQFAKALEQHWDLVIIPHAVSPKCTMRKAELAKAARCPVMILIWEQHFQAPIPACADAVLMYNATSAEIIARGRVLVAGKRGPKKHEPATPIAEVA